MTPFLSQMTMVGFPFPPAQWANCDGQILPIAQNQALFSLLDTQFGGDGRTTMALPDLRSRTPVQPHFSNNVGITTAVAQGNLGGSETVTLTTAEMPSHNHSIHCRADDADFALQDGTCSLAKATANAYAPSGSSTSPLSHLAIGNTGGSQPHDNLQPTLVVRFVIALQGTYPSRN